MARSSGSLSSRDRQIKGRGFAVDERVLGSVRRHDGLRRRGQLRPHHLVRQRERDLCSAREVAVTDAPVDLGAERRHEAAAYEGVGGGVWGRHDLEHGVLFQERVV